MIVIPAIDLHDGKCVRLLQGDFNRVTVYSEDPEMARSWQRQGAKRLHIVDLDGSLEERRKTGKSLPPSPGNSPFPLRWRRHS